VKESGGKGARLAQLTQRGFRVPDGFIIRPEAYRKFHEGALPEVLAQEVRQMLEEFPDGQAFAVRSSSTSEDAADAAYAGQHESFLNCVGEAEIIRSIEACWKSLWSERAVAYRKNRGTDPHCDSMAVVVQCMVNCKSAGVGFSVNPVTGHLAEIVIDANYGLGESVVAGADEVDHFVLDKKTKEIKESRIARKLNQVVAAGYGVSSSRVDEHLSTRSCLDEGQLRELADLISSVEKAFRFPQDIEWGYADGRFYLLQSRPVTTLPARWTRDESAERFPNPITPLTWDFVEEGFHRSLTFSFSLMDFPRFSGKWFSRKDNYIYGNQTAVALYGGRFSFRFDTFDALRDAVPDLRSQYRWVLDLPTTWMRDLDFYLLKVGDLEARSLAGLNIGEVWDYVNEVQDHGARYFLPNIAISLGQAGLHRMMFALVRLATSPEEVPQIISDLLAHNATKTGAINNELNDIASMARGIPDLAKILSELPSKGILARNELARFPEFAARFEQFLRDHGHRETDFDAYHPTWREVPWIVLDQIRLLIPNPPKLTAPDREREQRYRMQKAEFELLNRVPADLHLFYTEVIRLARAYTALDDLEHYQTTRLTPPLRKGLRELGKRLQEKEILDEPMDVFFAPHKDLKEAVQADSPAGWSRLGGTIRYEKQAHQAALARDPEWEFGKNTPPPSGDAVLTGMAGSPGDAEGAVHIVHGPEDFASFPAGAVLVARTTIPSWTPLFCSAAAVVTESGGPLCHGAVTAREMQIPAVVSARGAAQSLRNGERVRVDGARGMIYRTST